MQKYQPRKTDRRKTKVTIMDKEKGARHPVAPHLPQIMKAVEKGGGDVGKDTVLGILKQGIENFEDIRKDADRRHRGK